MTKFITVGVFLLTVLIGLSAFAGTPQELSNSRDYLSKQLPS